MSLPWARSGALCASLAVATLWLAACGGMPAAVPASSVQGGNEGSSVAPTEPTATETLLAQGQDAQAAGEYGAARALFERALRIEPNNASVWLALGELELDSGHPGQARAMAQKALSLAGSDGAVESSARALLSAAQD